MTTPSKANLERAHVVVVQWATVAGSWEAERRLVAQALDEAERRGAEAMRERAAKALCIACRDVVAALAALDTCSEFPRESHGHRAPHTTSDCPPFGMCDGEAREAARRLADEEVDGG